MRFFYPVLRFGTFYELPESFADNAAEAASLTEALCSDRNVRFAMQAGSESRPVVSFTERVVLFGQRGNEKLSNGVFATTRSCSHFTRAYDSFALWHRVCLFDTACDSLDEVTAMAWSMAEKLASLREHEEDVLSFVRARSSLKLDAPTRTNSMFTIEAEGHEFEKEFSKFFPDAFNTVKGTTVAHPLPGLLAIQREVFRDFVPGITGPGAEPSNAEDPPTETFGTETYRPLEGPVAVMATSRYRGHSSWAAVCSHDDDGFQIDIVDPEDTLDEGGELPSRSLRLGAAMVHDPALYEQIVKGAEPDDVDAKPAPRMPSAPSADFDRARLLSSVLRNMSQRSTRLCAEDKHVTTLGSLDHSFVDNIKIVTVSTKIDQHKRDSAVTTHRFIQKSDSKMSTPPTAVVWKDLFSAQKKYLELLRIASGFVGGDDEATNDGEPTIVLFGEFAFPVHHESEFLTGTTGELSEDDLAFIREIQNIVDKRNILLFTGTACETLSYTNCGFLVSPRADPRRWPRIEKRLSAEHLGEYSNSNSRFTLRRFEWRGISLAIFICFDVYDPNAHLSLVRSNYKAGLYDLILVPSFNEHGGGGDQVLSVCRKISRDAGLVAAYVNAVKAPESCVYVNGEDLRAREQIHVADPHQSISEYDVPIGGNRAGRYHYLRRPHSLARAIFESPPAS